MLKKQDTQIIAELRMNGRARSKMLSKKTGIPSSTIYEKITNHKPLISKYTCLLNYSELGYSVRAYIIFKAHPNLKEETFNFLMKNNQVNNLWKINGGYDFLMEAVFSDLLCVEEFKDNLQNNFKAIKIQIHYLIEELKRETFIPKIDS